MALTMRYHLAYYSRRHRIKREVAPTTKSSSTTSFIPNLLCWRTANCTDVSAVELTALQFSPSTVTNGHGAENAKTRR